MVLATKCKPQLLSVLGRLFWMWRSHVTARHVVSTVRDVILASPTLSVIDAFNCFFSPCKYSIIIFLFFRWLACRNQLVPSWSVTDTSHIFGNAAVKRSWCFICGDLSLFYPARAVRHTNCDSLIRNVKRSRFQLFCFRPRRHDPSDNWVLLFCLLHCFKKWASDKQQRVSQAAAAHKAHLVSFFVSHYCSRSGSREGMLIASAPHANVLQPTCSEEEKRTPVTVKDVQTHLWWHLPLCTSTRGSRWSEELPLCRTFGTWIVLVFQSNLE